MVVGCGRAVLLAGIAIAVLVGSAEAHAATTTVRVSVSSTGAEANGRSGVDAISPDGRFILFDSWATNLVKRDTNGARDVFLRDRRLGRTYRVSDGPGGRQANGSSHGVAMSSDGRFVVFDSNATNLTNLQDRNANADVFVRNRLRAKTFLVSVRPGGGQFFDNPYGGVLGAGISGDGRWVAFAHYTPYEPTGCCRGMGAFIRDRSTHTTRRIGVGSGWAGSEVPLALSPDGRWLILGRGTNFGFVLQDLITGRVRQVGDALSTFGGLTPDGRFIAYSIEESGEHLIRWDRLTEARRTLLSNPFDSPEPFGISADGGYVIFVSEDAHLVSGDTNRRADLYGYDVATKAVVRLDVTSTGGQITRGVAGSNGITRTAALSSDGRWVAFASAGGQLVPGDTNRVSDVFLRGPLPSKWSGG